MVNDKKLWYYVKDNQQVGPVSAETLNQLVRDAAIGADTLAWQDGMSGWLPIADIPEWKQHLPSSRDGLKLGQRPILRQTEPAGPPAGDATAPGGEKGPVDVSSMLQGNAVPRNTSAAINSSSGESTFEWSFFKITFAITIVAVVFALLIKPEITGLIMLAYGLLTIVVAGITFRVRTFQAGIWWGVLGLLFAITDIVFIFVHWCHSWRPILLSIMGTFTFVIGVFFIDPQVFDTGLWLEMIEKITNK